MQFPLWYSQRPELGVAIFIRYVDELAHEILLLITYAGSDGSDETAHMHMRSLVRAFAARIPQSMDVAEDSDEILDI